MSQQTAYTSSAMCEVNSLMALDAKKEKKKYDESVDALLALIAAIENEVHAGEASTVANTSETATQARVDGQSTSLGEVLSSVASTFQSLLEKNPELARQFLLDVNAKKVLSQYIKKEGDKAEKAIAQAFSPVMTRYLEAHPEGMSDLFRALSPLMGVKLAKQVATHFAEANTHFEAAKKPIFESFKEENTTSQVDEDPPLPSYSEVIGRAMMNLQAVITQLMSFQANQNTNMTNVGNQMLKALMAKQQEVNEQTLKITQAQAHFGLLNHVGTGISCVAMVFTFGAAPLGTALVMAGVSALLMSGAFNKCVEMITSGIKAEKEKEYYHDYLNEGKNPAEAKTLADEKAQAVANLMGKALMIGVVMAVVGIGGAASGAARGVATSRAMLAGTTLLVGSGVIKDVFMTNPEWCRNHKTELLVYTLILGVVLAAAGGYASKGAFSEAAGDSLYTKLANNRGMAKYIDVMLKVQYGVMICEAIFQIISSTYQGVKLQEAATYTYQLADLQKTVAVLQGDLSMNHQTSQRNLDESSQLTQSFTQGMQDLFASAGIDIDAANKILQRY